MQKIHVRTPEILWHGGNDNGKTSPVYSVDFLPLNGGLLVTSGTDGNVPPKGNARVRYFHRLKIKNVPALYSDSFFFKLFKKNSFLLLA